jgi:PAS domain S-box-containing protein
MMAGFSLNMDQLKLHLENNQSQQIIDLFQQLAEAYRLQQVRLESVLDTVNEAVCMIDESDKVVLWNHRAENLYGIPVDEILNQPIERFFSNLMISKVMKERRMVAEQYHNPCPDKHVLINAKPINLAGQVIGAVCCEWDVTEVVQLNQKLSQTHQEVQFLKQEINKIHSQSDSFAAIYGHSKAINEAISVARRVAATNVPVLLRGESGTGKELFARAIHKASQLSGPFIAINCGAISANLFESELFGYQAGAFTGADKKGKVGLLEQANGGTLLLDEIGDMPKDMQVKLLRTLQEKSFYPVGGGKSIHIEVRIIAATNCNLEDMIQHGDFREDLYYRLNVVAIILPSLRERLDDIPELVHKGLQYYSAIHEKSISRIDPALMAVLIQYQWPGNIRELFNVLERLVILADHDILGLDNLPKNILLSMLPQTNSPAVFVDEGLLAATNSLAREVIVRVLEAEHFNKASAAKKLGIPRSTLYYKMRRLGLEDCCQ